MTWVHALIYFYVDTVEKSVIIIITSKSPDRRHKTYYFDWFRSEISRLMLYFIVVLLWNPYNRTVTIIKYVYKAYNVKWSDLLICNVQGQALAQM